MARAKNCTHGEEYRRRHEFSDGSVVKMCRYRDCTRGDEARRAVLCPGMKFRPDPEPREPRSLKAGLPASLVAGLIGSDRDVVDAEEKETEKNEEAAEIAAFEENIETEPDSEYDLGDGEDADEPDEQDDYEAEA